ncbi:MAG: matrixin family metalloprotease [Phycisphaerales bacterium]|nr:matrixin family metalloprotease [Phycisphaerales bacterium]
MLSILIICTLGLNTEGLNPIVYHCETVPYVDGVPYRGGGARGDGWDGPGQGSTTIYFHVENTSADLASGQRSAVLFSLATWASFVQIHFVEIAASNWDRSIDFRFATGDHCAIEPDECGDPDCPFDGPGQVIAHAGFPPGVNSECVDPMEETWAGNVHFDDDEFFETDNAGSGISMTLISAHEIGHALGLTHNEGGGGPHIMRPTFSDTDGMQGPSGDDISFLQSLYASGIGSMTTLEDSGIWVNGTWNGPENGLPGNPFNSIEEGVAGLPPFNDGVTIHVLGGLYAGSLTISEPCTITAEFSTAYIGLE